MTEIDSETGKRYSRTVPIREILFRGVVHLSERRGIRVLERAFSVLNCIATADVSLGVTEISKLTGLSKTTVYRILSTMLDSNVLIRNPAGIYQLGPSVLFWGEGYRHKSSLIEISRPFMDELCSCSQETVHLFSYENGTGYYIDKRESPQPVGMKSRIGARIDLYCTSAGRAILAGLPKGELNQYLAAVEMEKKTSSTIIDREELIHILEGVRELGFAEENQENEEGIRCVGAALLNHNGYPVGAMSISAPAYRFSSEKRNIFGPYLRDKASEISIQLGWKKNNFQEGK